MDSHVRNILVSEKESVDRHSGQNQHRGHHLLCPGWNARVNTCIDLCWGTLLGVNAHLAYWGVAELRCSNSQIAMQFLLAQAVFSPAIP